MIDLIKILGLDHFFEILDSVKKNPGRNVSAIARELNLHIVTVQKTLDTLELYGFLRSETFKGPGRPSKSYGYIGGKLTIDLDELLFEYSLRENRIRDAGNPEVSFSFDVDRETVNAALIGGRTGKKIKFDDRTGRFLWLVPPPDSAGETIENLARTAGLSIPDAVRFAQEMKTQGIVEILE